MFKTGDKEIKDLRVTLLNHQQEKADLISETIQFHLNLNQFERIKAPEHTLISIFRKT